MAGFALTAEQRASYAEDGFVVVPRIIPVETAVRLRERFEPMFRGEFETGLLPDEWNWRAGRDADDLTRQICNGWKADRTIAATVLSRRDRRSLRGPLRLAGRAARAGQPAVEAAGRQVPGLPPG